MVVRSKNRPIQDVARPQVDDSKVQRALEAIITTVSALVRFIQPYVKQEPWQPLEYQPTWEDFSATTQPGSYRKDPMGRVWVRGDFLCSGAPSAGDPIAVLPIGYRPKADSSYLSWTDLGVMGEVAISSDGVISYVSGTVTHISLSFSFDTVG